MPGSADQPPGSPSSLELTPREPSRPDSVPHDTQPTGVPPHSTLPPEAQPASSRTLLSPFAPSSEAPSSSGETDQGTLHSVSHPGSAPGSHWDERRVLHLEREFDQLSAGQRLLDKRLRELAVRLRWTTAGSLLALVLASLWLFARG